MTGAFARADALDRLADERFDVLVIGGGITGAGVALDAASRGLRTALVERDDFASGTSSKSSKLVHGGIRYLQQREYRLVYDALRERRGQRRLVREQAVRAAVVIPPLEPVSRLPEPVAVDDPWDEPLFIAFMCASQGRRTLRVRRRE